MPAVSEGDPRRARSRAKLLDAATDLLTTGGVEAVTVDAVTRTSGVARATLYRHFPSTTDLVAAAFERLIPAAEAPRPQLPLRDRLVELLAWQASLLNQTPLQLTTMAWFAISVPDEGESGSREALRDRVIAEYRRPFDDILTSAEACETFGDIDLLLAECQLVGPLVFARLTGVRRLDRADVERIVDDFLAGRAAAPAPTGLA